jgi:putative thioredoxin
MEPIISASGDNAGEEGIVKPVIIKDATSATFVKDVLESSQEQPVLVQFHAAWSEPCKEIMPLLEKIVRESKGSVALIRVDIDQNRAIATQLSIQAVPTLYAFFKGQPIDAFQGALPEPQLRQFVKQLVKMSDNGSSGIDEMVEQAFAALDAGETDQAMRLLGGASHVEPENPAILGGLAQCYLAKGHKDEAIAMLESVPEKDMGHPAIAKARATIELMALAKNTGDVATLKAQADANPDDHQARFDLALACIGAGKNDEAAEQLMAIIKVDSGWNDNAARDQLFKMFDAAGLNDPFTLRWRRRLSSMLFS